MENILEKESVKRVIEVLNKFDENLKVEILNSSARTAEDAALSLNCDVGAIVKSLLLRTNNDFILCLVSGDKRCSLNKIKKITNIKDVSMADAEQVKNQTGFSIGGVSPVAPDVSSGLSLLDRTTASSSESKAHIKDASCDVFPMGKETA